MKIARVLNRDGRPQWALLDLEGGAVRSLDAPFTEWAPAAAAGDAGALPLGAAEPFDPDRLQAPVEPGGRIFGLGMNYITHLTRLGHTEFPAHPVAFLKPDTGVVHPGEDIAYPAITRQLDYEVELVAVAARGLGPDDDANACLLGYTIGNDISARDAGKQNKRSDLFGQKANAKTAPIGPWVVTLDEFGLGQPELDMSLRVNGETRQADNTRNMLFPMTEMLNYVDCRIPIRAGDVLFTGTTFGVGLEDGRLLQPGDLVEAEIDRIGVLANRIGPKQQLSAKRAEGRIGMPA